MRPESIHENYFLNRRAAVMMASRIVVTMIDTYHTSHTVMFYTRLNFDVYHVTITNPLVFENSVYLTTNRGTQ